MPYRWRGVALLLALVVAACGFSASREAAAEVMTLYFQAIQKRDYEAAVTIYAESLFRNTPQEVWEAQLESYTRQLGDLESYEAVSWNVKKNVGTKAGTFVRVVYKTQYSRQPALEQFILKKADGSFVIIAHRIEAQELPQGDTYFI